VLRQIPQICIRVTAFESRTLYRTIEFLYRVFVVAVVRLSTAELCDNRLSHQRRGTGSKSAISTRNDVCKWAGQSSAAFCYDVRGLSIQFSLRISFPKQRERSETDQTSDLRAVTRHLDPAGLATLPARRRPENGVDHGQTGAASLDTDRRRYVNRAARRLRLGSVGV